MNYKSLPDSIKLRIAKLPTPFFLFDLDHMMPKLYLKYGFIPFDRQVFGIDPYVELDLSLRNLKGAKNRASIMVSPFCLVTILIL